MGSRELLEEFMRICLVLIDKLDVYGCLCRLASLAEKYSANDLKKEICEKLKKMDISLECMSCRESS